jgi:hypothetical protein
MNGLTEDKEDGHQNFMDKLQVDVMFLSETFRDSPHNSSSQNEFGIRAYFYIIKMTYANRRRCIELRVRSHLQPLLTPIV